MTTYKLFKAFKNVLERQKNREDKYVHQIVKYPYTLKDQQAYIRSMISDGQKYSFDDIFKGLDNRMHAIVTFLALLELVNAQVLKMIEGLGKNNFYLTIGQMFNNSEEE